MLNAATKKHTLVIQNILRGGANVHLGREKCTKYNKINNNSENFRGQDCC